MKLFASCLLATLVMLTVNRSFAATYYVSWTNGNDLNTGTTLGLAFKTIGKAVSVAAAGDIIYLRGEVHSYSARINISKSGTPAARMQLLAYPGDASRPVLDFSAMAVNSSNRGLDLSGSYWTFKGFDIYKAGDNGMHVSGSFNIIDFCAFYENADTGLQFDNGASNNQVINCDAYYNIDPAEGNADGFAVKLNVGTGNSFKGCRAWQNSDDGWDGLLTAGFGGNPYTTYDSCWAFLNGYRKDLTASAGNGNGFKMGGNQELHDVLMTNCLAVHNRVKGFDQNNNKGSMTVYNCTGYKNKPNYGMNNYDPAAGKVMVVKNSISYLGQSADAIRAVATLTNNSWQSPFVTDANDFQSLDTSVLRAARNADGSLPAISFMKLVQGSDLINGGTNVGLPYNGSAPDLGYAESNYPMPVNLLSFSALVSNSYAALNWRTASETRNAGWEVERLLPGGWQKIGFIKGAGESNLPIQYAFNDPSPVIISVSYRLKQVDSDGKFFYSNVITIKSNSAAATELRLQPSLVNSSTVARLVLNADAFVQMRIIDLSGKTVITFAGEKLVKGHHYRQFNISQLASGTYLMAVDLPDGETLTQRFIKAIKE